MMKFKEGTEDLTIETFADYDRRRQEFDIGPKDLWYAGLGLSDEAGEAVGKIKKLYRDRNGIIDEETRRLILSELGDCLWYLSGVANRLGSNLETVATMNIEKLSGRKERGTLRGNGDLR
jgi:NTP pyrophosphatase (non-canonical NTP hydrolase)